MKLQTIASALGAVAICAATVQAQNAQVSSVAVQPNNTNRVWACNRDNGTVGVVDVATSSLVAEIPVGVDPRSLAFSADGTKVFVANQRGNIPHSANTVTGFAPGALRGTISVIDVGSLSVQSTLSNVGVEPYGVTVAPNGKYIAVSAMRSGQINFFDAQTLTQVAQYQYLRNLNELPPPFTMADADANRDGVADTGDPRGFVIRADSTRMYVTHFRSSYVSVLDIQLNANGLPTNVTLNSKIQTSEYPFDPILNPVPVQILKSQGAPRFLEDIALSPDGKRALIPHVLTNINHDVNHNFGPALAGDFANRVYPALTMIDAQNNTYAQPGDLSRRLHNELSDSLHPSEYVSYGNSKVTSQGNIISLGGIGAPVMGGTAQFVIDGMQPGDSAVLLLGQREVNLPFGSAGNLLVSARFTRPVTGTQATYTIPNLPTYDGLVFLAQVLVTRPGGEQALSNGLRLVVHPTGAGVNKMGYRAGQPSRVAFNSAGTRALMLNRGSEDLFLYRVTGSDMELMTVYPPRHNFQPRAPLDTTTPMGDLPLGMALAYDLSTSDDDARVFIINEVTRTLSVLRVNFTTGQITKDKNQIPTHAGADALTLSQRKGEELFEDASRPETAGNFNNSCGSCHFEGGEDANVWQRSAGPRSTMPMYGGSRATGLILWKGVRLNLGETGPMFAGENGGTGIFTDNEQQALTDFHDTLAFPLNPNLDPNTGGLTPLAALGQDLYFGTNDTGLNPTNRQAGCAVCHPKLETNPGNNPGPRFFSSDFLNPVLTSGENLGSFDPSCFALRENIVLGLNIRNVNTGVNADTNFDGIPDADRNADGYVDLETYTPMNNDLQDNFRRDDSNSYMCPCDPNSDANCDPLNPLRIFTRKAVLFSVPQKVGAWSTGPYFHDHAAMTLRTLLDPEAQAISPVYGSPAFPGQTPFAGLNKVFNENHDIRGHEQFAPGASKVQATLHSTNVNADLEAILAFVQSL